MSENNKQFQLPKEFADKWLSALRSGKYQQGTGHLKDDDRYCCLGVACDISSINLDIENGGLAGFPKRLGLTAKKILPELLIIGPEKDEEGYDYNNSVETQSTFVGKVARMNDDGKSFPEIADYIESICEFV